MNKINNSADVIISKEDELYLSEIFEYNLKNRAVCKPVSIKATEAKNKKDIVDEITKNMKEVLYGKKLIVTDSYSEEFVENIKKEIENTETAVMFFASSKTDELLESGKLSKQEVIGSKIFTGEIYKLIEGKYNELKDKANKDKVSVNIINALNFGK